MRLKTQEIEQIKTTLETIFNDISIYLFGSRMDEKKKGGDIDLFIISNDENLFEKKIKALAKLKRILRKPVDIVIHRDFTRKIEIEALKGIRF
ncbi:nucleotidyltransferase domain-containing protein [Sulfurimonas sp. SAG-AH-194-C21]|nr:nucleotidyltransferase domain-containing protein [Sulfurimonas sp. SAG-AH-194-C21]MDF1883611.1 nucleotidyltransferase domain-containing protein [Sulfurimonas sp. SAG-AH-194-C21]